MFERERDIVDRVIAELRRPVKIDPGLDARVLREIATAPARPEAAVRGQPRRLWGWGSWGSWGGWLAAAATVVFVLVARPWLRTSKVDTPFQFVLVAPQAASVALVGDFNDWDPARAPMQTAHGVWATVVQLRPGRYRYAFLVNGVEWRADPGAPHAADDEFGTPNSVVTVGGTGL